MSLKFIFTIGGSITLPVEYMGASEAPCEMLQFNLVLASLCRQSKLTQGISLTCDFVMLVSVGFSHFYIFFSHEEHTNCCLSKKKTMLNVYLKY